MDDRVSAWTVDKEELLLPIAPDRPAGSDLRYDGTYDRIKEARRADDPSLPQGVWQSELKRADWATVEATCLDALTTQTKDLQIVAWLLEAWIHLHGIAGATAGLEVLSELCERFWPNLYPDLNGNNLVVRTAPLRWVNERLPNALKLMPVARPQAGDVPACTWLDWETALHQDNLPRRDPGSSHTEAQKKILTAQFQESVTLTPTRFYAEQVEKWDEAVRAAGELEALVNRLAGDQAPSFSNFKKVLASIRRFIAGVLAERNGAIPLNGDAMDVRGNDAEAEIEPELYEVREGGAHRYEVMSIKSRAEAYHRLASIADYLMKVEPHSPAPYLVKRAVQWGSMSLSDLLLELVSDASDLRSIYGLLGIQREGG